MTRKVYLSAPFPFVGQKRIFVREFIRVLEQPSEDTVFVDLFGGSELLSHTAKCRKPDATVVYNDFDNYRRRMAHVPQTNRLIVGICGMVGDAVPRRRLITGELRERMLRHVEQEEWMVGCVDFITLLPPFMLPMKYRLSVPEIRKEALYNNIRKVDYPGRADYLDGLEIVSCDYKEVFGRYKDTPGAVSLTDPPYLSTDVGTYNMYWHTSDYPDVLNVPAGYSFVYFTSNKFPILKLREWIEGDRDTGSPFERCTRVEFNAYMNYNAPYTDMMLYRKGVV